MIGRPVESEADSESFTYINKVLGEDPVATIESQFDEAIALVATISEEASRSRYAPDKWSIRQWLNHITDTERVFALRALWFARGFDAPMPGYDQDIAASGAQADTVSWAAHVEEFRAVRQSTISLFRNMPPEGWKRGGIANENFVSVRALAWVIPGHVAHHLEILRERYLR